MDSIRRSSDQTPDIVKTLDETAFQACLLALNGAVEATTRSVKPGKDSAAIMEEVRNLAMLAAKAAQKC